MKTYKIMLVFLVSLLLIPLAGRTQSGECLDDKIVLISPDNDIDDMTADYRTKMQIEASNKIDNGASVLFTAADGILLKDGFAVLNNSDLLVEMKDCMTTSTDEVDPLKSKNDDFVNVYPNPAINLLNIEILSDDITQMSILSVDGKLMKEIIPNENLLSLDISNLEGGMYFLQVQLNDGQQKNHRFIKMK